MKPAGAGIVVVEIAVLTTVLMTEEVMIVVVSSTAVMVLTKVSVTVSVIWSAVVVWVAVTTPVTVSVIGAGVTVVEGVLVIHRFATKGMVRYREVVGTGFFAVGPSFVLQTFKTVLVLKLPVPSTRSALAPTKRRRVATFMVMKDA